MTKKKKDNVILPLSYQNKNVEAKTSKTNIKSTKGDNKAISNSVKNVASTTKNTVNNANTLSNDKSTSTTNNNMNNDSLLKSANKHLVDIRNNKIDEQQKELKEKQEKERIKSITSNKYDEALKDSNNYLKDSENEFRIADKEYQKKREEELKKNNINFQNKFEDKTKKKISFDTKNTDTQVAKPVEVDSKTLRKVEQNLKVENNKREKARNEWKYAQYVNDAVKAKSGKVSVWDKTGENAIRAAADLFSLGTLGDRTYKDTEGNIKYLPSYNDLKQQEVEENYDTKIGKFLGDTLYNSTKILGATGLDAISGGTLGKAAYWTDMATDNYTNVKNQGYKDGQAIANTLASTGSEFLTEKMLGGLTKNLTGGKASGVQNAIANKLMQKTGKAKLSNALAGAASEGLEEFTQEYIDKINDLATLKNSTNPQDYVDAITSIDNLKSALYSGGIGMATGGTLNAMNNVDGKQVQENIDFLNQYREELAKAKDSLSNQQEKNVYDGAINKINDYNKQPFNSNFSDTFDSINPTNLSQRLNEVRNQDIANASNNFNLGKNDNKSTNTINSQVDKYGDFNKQIDAVQNGTYPKRDALIVRKDTPSIYQELGLKNFPITMTQKHLYTITNSDGKYNNVNYHNIDIDTIKQLPKALETPLNILKSSTRDDSIVVITELADKNENPIIASVKIDGEGRINDISIDSNALTSAYGKNNYDSFMKKEIENGNLLYDIDEGIKKRITRDRVQFPMQGNSSIKNIPQTNQNVNLGISNNSNMQQKQNNSQNDILYANKQNDNEILRINDDGTSEFTDGKPKILDKNPTKQKESMIERGKETWKEARRALFDKGQEVYDIAKKTKNKTLYHKYDNIGTAPSEAQSQIGEAQTNLLGKKYKNFTDKNGNKTSMSVESIWKDANDSGISDKTLNEYLVNQLNIDRLNQGTEQFSEMSIDDSQDVVDKLEKEYPQIKRVAENIWQYNKNQLQRMVDGGLISQETADSFMNNTPHYVRIQRDTGKHNNSLKVKNGKVEINNQIQKVKGGSLDILPLKETMAQYTQDVTNSIRKNIFGKELAKTLGVSNQNADVSAVDESFGINPELLGKDANGNYTFTIFDNGNATVVPINEGIYKALEPNKAQSKLGKLNQKIGLGRISSIQRTLLTDKNPIFMLTNFFKDIGDAPLNSKYGMGKFYKNYLRLFGGRTVGNLGRKTGVMDSNKVNVSDYVNLYESLGGSSNSYFNQGEFESNKGKASKAVDKVLAPIEKGNEFIESMPRVTEFVTTIEQNGYTLNKDGDLVVKNNKKATKSVDDVLSEAMYNAAEITTNFKRGGNSSKAINRNGGTFFNASMQGFSKFTRNFTEIDSPKQVVNLMAKVAILGVAPAMLGEAMYGDDDEYKDLPDYVKDEYYLFKDKKGNWSDENGSKWLRIPKGRMMSIFGSAARRTKGLSNGDKDAFKGFGAIVSNQIAPNNPLENNAISPFLNVKNNKSWSGNAIVSDYLKNDTYPEEEYDAKTSSLSKWLGDKLNYSPKKIDYLLDQYTGGIGDVLLPAMTNYAESDDDTTLGRLIKNPMKNKFTTDSTLNNKTVSQYYDLMDEIEDKNKSIKATTLDRAKAKYVGDFSEAKTKLSELYKEQRDIQNSTNMSDKEKYNKSKAKQKEIISTMKQTMDEIKNAYDDNGTISIGDKTYAEVEEDGKKKIKSYSMAKVNEANDLGISVSEYAKINSKIDSLKADKNENGKAIRDSKKKKVFEYISSLDLTAEQKMSIYRSHYKKD